MNPDRVLVDAMFARHRISGPRVALPATGIANRIYATDQVVLRLATDHPESVSDARTESVAAPVAHAAGILTPRMVAFDDSRSLVDRPYSLWERVHGATLGLIELDHCQLAEVWRQVGRQLFRLHDRVRACADPNGYLDTPGRDLDLLPLLNHLANARRLDAGTALEIEWLITELAPHIAANVDVRFIHNDIHEMNVMCTPAGEFLAIIDWGDAGWGDPTLDFAAIPLPAISYAREGYESESAGALGAYPEARFIWDRLRDSMEAVRDDRARSIPLEAFHRFLRSGAR